MSFGGDDDRPSAPSYPALTQKEMWRDFIDRNSRTQVVRVKNPDGTETTIHEPLPRSEEEQRYWDLGGELMDKASVELKKLAEYDPSAIVDFKSFVDVMNVLNTERKNDMAELSKIPDFNQVIGDFKAMQNRIIEDEFRNQQGQQEAYLNRRGLDNSTGSREMAALMAGEKAKALEQANINSEIFGEQKKAADLSNRANTFGFREQGRLGQLQNAEAEYRTQLESKNREDVMKQQALSNQGNLFSIGAKLRGDDLARTLGSRAPELANTIWQQGSMDNLNRYNSQVNQINSQFANEMSLYNSRPTSFMDKALTLGGMGVGAYFGGPWGAMAGGQAGGKAGRIMGQR